MNPCPCGYYGHPTVECRCSPVRIQRYVERISGPLLDRFDLRVHLGPQAFSATRTFEETSAKVHQRILRAREQQLARGSTTNGRLSPGELESLAIEAKDKVWLEEKLLARKASMRRSQRILRLARTLADLEQQESLLRIHLEEAFMLSPPLELVSVP